MNTLSNVGRVALEYTIYLQESCREDTLLWPDVDRPMHLALFTPFAL